LTRGNIEKRIGVSSRAGCRTVREDKMNDEMIIRWIEDICGAGDYDSLTIPGSLQGVDL